MKITIYTINDCKFSQAEKDYLQSKNLPFEEKNLETNREYLTEMLNISNNFAGTPVTKIEKDDGTSMVMKGFTQTEFDAALGTGAPVTGDTTVPPVTEEKPAEVKTEEPAPVAETPSTPVTPPPVESTPMPTMPTETTPSMGTPVSPSPMNTAAPSAPTMTPQEPMSMNTPPTVPDFSAPQGGPIPNPAAQTDVSMPDTANSAPAADPMNILKQNPPTPPKQENSNQQTANDPLSSVLNDLQSKGNSS